MNNTYALAFFNVASQRGKLDQIYDSLRLFYEVYGSEQTLKTFLETPLVNVDEKKDLLVKNFEALDADVIYFLNILADNNAFVNFDEIFEDFQKYYYDFMHIKEVVVKVNKPLDEAEKQVIKKSFDKMYPLEEIRIREVVSADDGGYQIFVDGKRISSSIIEGLDSLKKSI